MIGPIVTDVKGIGMVWRRTNAADRTRNFRSHPNRRLLLSGSALQARGLRAAARLRAATGVGVFADRHAARMARGADIPAVERISLLPRGRHRRGRRDSTACSWSKPGRQSRSLAIPA